MNRRNLPDRFGKLFARGVALAAVWTFAGGAVAWAQTAPAKVPDLSGFWERKDEFGGGNFGGTLERIPKASIKPEFIEAAKRAAAAAARGEVVSFGSKWCLTNSYPFFMQHSAAWD